MCNHTQTAHKISQVTEATPQGSYWVWRLTPLNTHRHTHTPTDTDRHTHTQTHTHTHTH